MASNFDTQIKRARGAFEDGSLAFPRYAEEQLFKLYNALSARRDELAAALEADVGLAQCEALFEVASTLELVKRLATEEPDYEKWSKRREQALRVDGHLERGKGVVVVAGDAVSPLYSVVAPFATAISAGNAVVCLLPDAAPTVCAILKSALSTALNRFAYIFVPASQANNLLTSSALPSDSLAITRYPVHRSPSQTLITSAGEGGATVLIDRLHAKTSPADLAHLARRLVRGKFYALGRLPGSVQRVLVHEESAGALVDAVLEEIKTSYGANAALSSDYGRYKGAAKGWDGEGLLKKANARVLCGGGRTVADSADFFPPTVVSEPSSDLLKLAANGPLLPIKTFASHEDAFVMLSKIESSVLYLFAQDTLTLDYLATEANFKTTYANDIPLPALYNPHGTLTDRSSYVATSRLLRSPSSPSSGPKALFAPFTPSRLAALASLLPREKQLAWSRKHHSNSILRVFFLQGVMLTVGTIFTVLVGTTGWVGWLAAKWVKRTYFA
ncbi:hypothetical protein JCM10207_009218 [Rhodosporidiobolus poonsookiae]